MPHDSRFTIHDSRPLHVLHLAHVRWFNAEVQYAVDLAAEMNRLGHRAEFLGLPGSPGVREARACGLETHEEAGFNGKGIALAGAVTASLRLRRLLEHRRFDGVEVHRSEALPLVAWACRRAGVPVVRVRGDMRPVRRDPLNRWLYTSGLSAVVASNSWIARSLAERLGPGPRVEMIPGGVDPDRFSPDGPVSDLKRTLGVGPDARLVGILGRLGEVKGHDDFLAAAARAGARVPDLHFVILAKELTPRGAEFLDRARGDHPGLGGRVHLLGPQDDLPGVLRAFDLGVVASTGSEANCRVGLEWMASGVPLVATRVGVLPDLVADGVTGALAEPGDASGLAEKIVYCADDPQRAHALGRAARHRVEARFSLNACARAHVDLLCRLRENAP